ncbi:MAG: L-arabinose isomerase [Microbacteriaceae bacterium]
MSNNETKEIWFLTGSQDLYGDDTLKQVAEQSKDVMARLERQLDGRVSMVWKPTLKNADAIRRTMLEASASDACIGVITWMHTFSPAKMWISGLDALQKPLLHLHTQANQSLPWSTIDMDFMNLNQAAHGDREYAHMVTRMGVARKIVVGDPASKHVGERVQAWVTAAIGFNKSKNLKLARFGDNMRFVSVTDGDKVSAQMALGISVENYGVNALVEAVAALTDADAEALTAEYERLYDVAPELSAGGARHDSLVYAAKQEIALRGFLEAGGFSAFTSNFEDLGDLKQLPGLAVQRLMADGYGFGGEGDWKTSALGAILKSMTVAGGGTSFMEDYTYHFGPGPSKVLGAHMLEVCPTITSAKPKIEIHPLGIGGKEDPVRMVFTASPADARVVCLVDLGDRFRIVQNEIKVVEPNEDLPNLPVARAVWEPKPTLEVSAEAWMLAGGSHHTVLTNSVSAEAIEDFARMAKVELVVIDEDTKMRDFRKELQWSAAYHRLAERL